MPQKAKKLPAEESDSEMPQKGGAKQKTLKSKAPAKKAGSKSASVKKTSKKTTARKSSKTRGSASREEGRKRYFKMVDKKTGKSFGRYTGATPKQAASKCYTKQLQKYKESGQKMPKESIIYIRESTRGCLKKVYGYSASRLKLKEPQELNIADKTTGDQKTIVYHYRNKIKKVPVPEQLGGVRTTRKAKAGSKTSKKGASKSAAGRSKAGSKKAASSKKSSKSKATTSSKKPVKKRQSASRAA